MSRDPGRPRPVAAAATDRRTEVDDYFIAFARRMRLGRPIICDIGSRDAVEGVYLYDALDGSTLHVFEPNPEAAAQCRRTIEAHARDDDVVFNQLAVSDTDGPVDFHPVDVAASVQKDIGFSSMYHVNPRFTARRGAIRQGHIRVQATTLDSYFAGKDKPAVLWIDVEGAELKVLHGAEAVLPAVRLIHVEVSFRPMHLGKPLFWEIDRFLRDHGFELDRLVEDSRLKGFLYRHRLLPNLPWRKNAVYFRRE